jgi:hypothetical protein
MSITYYKYRFSAKKTVKKGCFSSRLRHSPVTNAVNLLDITTEKKYITNPHYAPLAQWIEHLASNQRVGGSSPSGRNSKPSKIADLGKIRRLTR